jgi:hypothetical protein
MKSTVAEPPLQAGRLQSGSRKRRGGTGAEGGSQRSEVRGQRSAQALGLRVVGQPHRLPCPGRRRARPTIMPTVIDRYKTWSVGRSCRGDRVGRNKSCRRHACRYRPLQAINDYALTLVRPIPCIINQPCPNGIVANVEPFFAIALLTPQDMIEKTRLP